MPRVFIPSEPKVCLSCGKEFFRKKRWGKKLFEEQKFCSNKCVGVFNKGNKHALGYKHTPEELEKIALHSRKENHPMWKGGAERLPKCPDCGKRLSSMNSKYCHKHAFERMRGENHPNWVNGNYKKNERGELYMGGDSATSYWRKSVYQRDNYKCRIADGNCKGRLEAHHILPWRSYPELRYAINNGITLCAFHHPHKWEEEKRLAPTFTELVSVSEVQN